MPPELRSTVAVIGDWPYSHALISDASALYESVNNDPDVSLVIHVGDIHSGDQPCTGAELNPLPNTSDPLYNQRIFDILTEFQDPVVYTPGDNEWADCHKTSEGASGDHLNELAALRRLFFPLPGIPLAASSSG